MCAMTPLIQRGELAAQGLVMIRVCCMGGERPGTGFAVGDAAIATAWERLARRSACSAAAYLCMCGLQQPAVATAAAAALAAASGLLQAWAHDVPLTGTMHPHGAPLGDTPMAAG